MDDKELAEILDSTAEDLALDYYLKFADLLAELGICSELESEKGIPLEIWTALAQPSSASYNSAAGNASGLRRRMLWQSSVVRFSV